jgi:hypothetical protein
VNWVSRRECIVSWLDDLFLVKHEPNHAQPAQGQAVTQVSLPSGERPSWAADGTALYRVLDESWGQSAPLDVQPVKTVVEATADPLPQDGGTWQTRHGHEVTTGDLVALNVRGNPDAMGRIVGAAANGLVECVLGDYDDPRRTRVRLHVSEDDLVALLRTREGVRPQVPSDYAYATPLMRDPETETEVETENA